MGSAQSTPKPSSREHQGTGLDHRGSTKTSCAQGSAICAPQSTIAAQGYGVDNTSSPTILAQTHGVVNAPQISHSQFLGAVTFNMVTHMHNTAGDAGVQKVSTKLKSTLKKRFESIFEGIAKRGNPTLLNRIFTELYITEGEREVDSDELQIGQTMPMAVQEADISARGGYLMHENEHEMWQLDTASRCQPLQQDAVINCNDIFKRLPGLRVHIRTVMTKGVAGIGKTVSVQKFILDWAEEKANQDLDLVFVLPFRELNHYQGDQFSLHGLLKIFHPEVKLMKNLQKYDEAKIVFIFDGLDESQLPLSFQGNKFLADVTQRSSLDELLTNLFKGNLLPSAHIWITSRPASVHRISSDCVHRVTEIRGFSDSQKEEYFRKRIPDERQANAMISHIRALRSLHTMCHIPIFCWIISTVMERTLSGAIRGDIPYTLTGMYIRFLLIQTNIKNQKFYGEDKSSLRGLCSSDVQVLLQMGKLAFENLERSKLIFSDRDLKAYGLKNEEMSVHSGLFTSIIRREDPMCKGQWYSFIHLSIQEFLAALYVFLSFVCERTNPFQRTSQRTITDEEFWGVLAHTTAGHHRNYPQSATKPGQKTENQPLTHEEYLSYVLDDSDCDSEDEALTKAQMLLGQQPCQNTPQNVSTLHDLHRVAVERSLESSNGHLDLFVRFLLGLSLEANYSLLRCLHLPPGASQENVWKTTEYIKHKLRVEDQRKCPSPERCINLLHCLAELGDTTVVQEIQSYLTCKNAPEKKLTAAQCSALAYMMLTSDSVLDEFDLSSYRTSAGGRRRLVPLVRCSRKARLANCQLTRKCFETVSLVLQSAGSPLRELDLSHNFLVPQTLDTLCVGLASPHCSLDSLNLSYINLEQTGMVLLRAVLLGPHQQPTCLRLSGCYLRDDCSDILLAAFQSDKSRLSLLDLSFNRMTDAGVACMLTGLKGPHCKLHTLRLGGCEITEASCKMLGSVLQTSCLRELDLSGSGVGDEGVRYIFTRTATHLEKLRLRACDISDGACDILGEVVSSSALKELDLQDNDLGDTAVKLLCTALIKPTCILQSLRLSGCLITEEGCSFLASALKTNPSHLQVLDLSYNYPGERGIAMLSKALGDPNYKLETLNMKDGGAHRIKPLMRKYTCEVTLDPDSKHKELHVSPDNKMAAVAKYLFALGEKASWFGVGCAGGLAGGRFYWEVEWRGLVVIGARHKGRDSGYHRESWSLYCNSREARYEASHNNSFFRMHMADRECRRVGVYLDWPAGTLSFYAAASDKLTHLHTFHSAFTKPLYPEFYLYDMPDVSVAIVSV
ncbi:hypothetical protein ACEWY4_017441 [Coilia grayii]|uniref:NACHT, LRR and PYD domains-containing protein 12-like n=1 Tax=Coilia grayii TaxID=363190 RepID=A0ABD1JH47_9TELE